MRSKGWIFLLLANIFACVGCEAWKAHEAIDRFAFVSLDRLFFTRAKLATIKEIHLDNGALMQTPVLVEGTVLEIGNHQTYFILGDETAKLIVLLTDLDTGWEIVQGMNAKTVKVLGSVEMRRRGIPVVKARAIKQMAKDKGMEPKV